MITLKELLDGREANQAQLDNLNRLLLAMNAVRTAYGKPMTVTSGLRTIEDQLRIYKGRNPKNIPMKSAHLEGLAVDISDRTGELWDWCLENLKLLETLGLYLEDKNSTRTWVHFQLRRPASGNRIFVP
jgi:hypothetical protein